MKSINSTELIANSKFNRFHFELLLWSLIIILFDGYDLVVYGTVVPSLIEEWNLSSVEAGAIGTYGLFRMMFGAIFFGTLADLCLLCINSCLKQPVILFVQVNRRVPIIRYFTHSLKFYRLCDPWLDCSRGPFNGAFKKCL